METLKFRITGTAPLLMHNGRLADPLDEFTKKIKKISSKRNKTDADHLEMARIEWHGSLYLNEDGLPCIPSYVMEGPLTGRGGAAGKVKMRKQGEAGMFIQEDAVLEYEGPTSIDELWEDKQFRLRAKVKIGQSSVMRTRPMFREWSAVIEIWYNPELLNPEAIVQWMDVAGDQVGLMDWRPKYGRFVSEQLAE